MSGRDAFIDRPAARGIAILVALAAASALAWIHRDDLFPPAPGADPANPAEAAFRACYDARAAQIAESVANAELTAEQGTLFTARAEAFCRDTAGGGNNAGPKLPGQ